MENILCDKHRNLRCDKNLLLDDKNVLPNRSNCSICKQSYNRSRTNGTLFNIEDVNWQDRDISLQNPLFLNTNSADSRLSANSGDSIDAPLLLHEHYTEVMDEFHCHTNTVRKQENKALRKLLAASCMCLLFMVAEIVGGYLANSLSIMTDAAHLMSDFIGFLVSVFSIWLGQRPNTKRHSWGFHRAEVLGALFSITFIWLLTAIFIYLAVVRLINGKYDIDANTMMLCATIGVFINLVMGMILHSPCNGSSHSHGLNHSHSSENQGNINVRAAIIHVLGDFIQSIGVLVAAIIIKFNPDAKIADPICTFIFSIIVIFTTRNVMRDTLNILMESVPLNINYNQIMDVLHNIDGVRHVHSLHVWSLTTNKIALTAHLAVDKYCDKGDVLQASTRLIRSNFPITLITIQVENYREEIIDSCTDCRSPSN